MYRVKNVRGFSLIELLIVVAIIGVLSTIGIPTFRNMVTKAKKAEPKAALAGLSTIESAFFAEYSSYGSHIDKMGFSIDGNTRLYSVGFPQNSTGCTDQYANPLASEAGGLLINAAFPSYYSSAYVSLIGRSPSGGGDCYVGTAGGVGVPYNAGNTCPQTGIPASGQTYVASATGAIAAGTNINSAVTCGGGGVRQSAFIIDSNKALIEVSDPL